MSFIFSDISITDEWTGSGGGGVPYLNGNVTGKHVATVQGYFYLAYLGMYLRFDTSDNSITNLNDLDFRSFFDDGNFVGKGLKKGRTITIEGTSGAGPDNDGSYTIASISDDGRTIYTVEALTVTMNHDDVDIFDDTVIDSMDFYYNLIENSAPESYLSLTDRYAIQKFTADDLGASDTSPINMLVASSSFGWVTNKLSDDVTGETDEVTVEGIEIVDHKQYFKIIQTFRIAPFAKADHVNNITDLFPPDYFTGGRCLKYICQVDGKFDATDPDIPHSSKYRSNVGVVNASGLTAWYNDNNIHSRADYYYESIAFEIDSEEVEAIDINEVTSVVITVKSRQGKFLGAATKFSLDFIYFPLNDSRYINTPDRTLLQNFLNDRKFGGMGVTADGENAGTEYQVLKNVQFEFVDVNTTRVNFDVDFSDEIKAFLKTLPEENRKYFFVVTTQDRVITETIQVDRVAVITPLAAIGWNKSNPALVRAFDNLRGYLYPQIGVNPFTSISGYEGDPFYLEFPFQVLGTEVDEVTPTIKKAGFQIVLNKAGQDNFVLEEKIFDSSLVRKLNGVQTIDISEEKSFQDVPEEYNTDSLKRDETYDDVGSGSDEDDYYGFIPHYASTLRYEYWASLVSDSERFAYPIFKTLDSPTEAWGSLAAEGWELKVRFVATVEGYEGFTEDFEAYWDIECKTVGEAPDEGPVFTSEVEYKDYDTNIITNGISKGGKTLITRTYEGDFSSLPSGFNSLFAYIFADYEGGGGETNRRFASSEFDALGENNPFSDPGFLPSEGDEPDHSWASKNLRISLYGDSRVVITTIYDDTANTWSDVTEAILIYPKLGFMAGCFMLTEGGGYVLNEMGQRLQLENCEEDSSS